MSEWVIILLFHLARFDIILWMEVSEREIPYYLR
jgi:hypothetical protein